MRFEYMFDLCQQKLLRKSEIHGIKDSPVTIKGEPGLTSSGKKWSFILQVIVGAEQTLHPGSTHR